MTDVVIRLGAGETAVVGYGLLLSRATVDTTLGHRYEGPYVACHVAGWRRSWDVSMPNAAYYYGEEAGRVYPRRILYLNVRRDPHALMNGVVFVLAGDDLAAMNSREWIYDGVVVTSDLRDVQIEGGDALMYAGKPEHSLASAARPSEVGLRRSYLDLLAGVLDAAAPVVRSDYRATTDPVPEHLVIDDSLDPHRISG